MDSAFYVLISIITTNLMRVFYYTNKDSFKKMPIESFRINLRTY